MLSSGKRQSKKVLVEMQKGARQRYQNLMHHEQMATLTEMATNKRFRFKYIADGQELSVLYSDT
jgi:hypothetical protein